MLERVIAERGRPTGGRSDPELTYSSGDRSKTFVRPRARRELAEWVQQVHLLSQPRVAQLLPVDRMTLRYLHHRDTLEALRVRLRGNHLSFTHHKPARRTGTNRTSQAKLSTDLGLVLWSGSNQEAPAMNGSEKGGTSRPLKPSRG